MPRFLELILIFLVMLVLAIPICLTALAIIVALGRPIFFRQIRAGKLQAKFEILKFRTMTNATDAKGVLLPDDQRQTALTWLIRRTRLDELPQLLAILKGDMALVGPRPLLPATIDEFGELGVQRCLVRPGLSGWSQVSGNVNLTNFDKIILDLWYVQHRTMMLDLRILAETVLVLIAGERVHENRIAEARKWLTDEGLNKLC